MDRLAAIVDIGDRWITAALDALVVAMAGLLLLLLNWAVFARFVLNDSVSWGEELPAHVLAALTFIGAAFLTRTNEHLGFDAVLRILPQAVKRAVICLNLLLMGGFGALLAWYGGIAAQSFAGRTLISIELPVILFRGTMAVGGLLILAFCVVRLVGIAAGRINPDDLFPESDG